MKDTGLSKILADNSQNLLTMRLTCDIFHNEKIAQRLGDFVLPRVARGGRGTMNETEFIMVLIGYILGLITAIGLLRPAHEG